MVSLRPTLTCPECGSAKDEAMPTDARQCATGRFVVFLDAE